MEAYVSGTALFFKQKEKELIELCATFVDYDVHAGYEAYRDLCKDTEKKFRCELRQWPILRFLT